MNNAEIISIYCHIYEDNRIYFSSENEVKVKCDTFLGSNLTEFRAFSIGAFVQILGALLPHGARFEINEGNIFINDEVSIEGFSAKITGVLCRIETLKKNFPEDIKLNEPIMTDKTTRLKITLSGVDKPWVGKINIAENTKVKFNSENSLEVIRGKIYGRITKVKAKSKFQISTDACALTVRGTEYILDVGDDSATTLTVLEGVVEISDKQHRKTVLVTKDQQVVVKPGELPSEPTEIDPEQILKWWDED